MGRQAAVGTAWRLVLIALLVVIVPATGASAAPGLDVTVFTAGISGPIYSLAAGADGNVWYLTGGSVVGRITPDGVATEFTPCVDDLNIPRLCERFNDIASGPDGNVWVTGAGFVGYFTTAGDYTRFDLIGFNLALAAGPDGNVWVTNNGQNLVHAIRPDGTQAAFKLFGSFAPPQPIAAGPDGNLWVGTIDGIGKLTTAAELTEFTAGFARIDGAGSVVAGPDGNLWITHLTSSAIGRVTTAGVLTDHAPGPTPGTRPAGLAAGSDGNLWFTMTGADRIGRMTTAGVVTEYPGVPAGTEIVAGPDGNVWYASGASLVRVNLLPGTPVPEVPSAVLLSAMLATTCGLVVHRTRRRRGLGV